MGRPRRRRRFQRPVRERAPLIDLGEEVAGFLGRHAIAAPLLACSGGPDSLVLLLATADATRAAGTLARVAVVHVDHGLRKGGAREAGFVQAAAIAAGVARRRVRAVTIDKDLRAHAAKEGRSLEEVARDARYQALGRAAQALSCDAILTGHTATDQVETLLLHLLRGAGTRGLGGMRELVHRQDLPSILGDVLVGRPLLSRTRAEVLAFLAARDVKALADPSNDDARHLRNRVRHEVVPALRAVQPALEAVVSRAAQNLRDDADALDALAAAVPLEAVALLAAPRAVRFRALARAARAAGIALETVHLPAIERLLEAPRQHSSIDLPGGRAIRHGSAVGFGPPVRRR